MSVTSRGVNKRRSDLDFGFSLSGLIVVIGVCLLAGMHPVAAEETNNAVIADLLDEMEAAEEKFDASKLRLLPIEQFKLVLDALMPESAAVGDADPQEIVALIHQLGARSFSEREKARARLISMPNMVLSPLNYAQESPDLEIAHRARSILQTKADLTKTDDKAAFMTARKYGKAYRKFLQIGASHEQLEVIARRTMMALRMGRRRSLYNYDIMSQGILAVARSKDDSLINLFEPAIEFDSPTWGFLVYKEIRAAAPEAAMIKMVDQVEISEPVVEVDQFDPFDPFDPFGRPMAVPNPFGTPIPSASNPFGAPDKPDPNADIKEFRRKYDELRKQRQ